ncbi:MAG: ABC transporter substrate-binding protein [Chloroflexi bacterium]|nr:ABC transporter substrate-binding protein [Chloroflexota bacterium]
MKTKKFQFIILLIVIGLIASACTPSKTPDNASTQAENVESLTLNIGDWDSPDPQNLPSTVKVGVLFGLSGDIAVYGEVQQRGVQLAVQQINASGYLGQKTQLEALFEDTGASGEGAIAAMDTVIGDGVVAVLGPTLSTQAFSADPIAQENSVPVMGVSNTANGITDMGDFVFRNSLPEASVVPGTITQVEDILGLKSVGVLWGNDDDFTASGYDVFKDALLENEIEIVADETFARGDVDFNAQLTNIIGESPDAIVVSALAQEAVQIIVQARNQGFDGPIIGGNGFNSPAIISQAGEAAEGVIVGAAWNIASDADISQDFIQAFEAEYGNAPDQFAAQAYTGMWLLATAIRHADDVAPATIRDELAAIKDFDSPLGLFNFDDNRNPVHDPVVQIIRNGSYEILSAETAAP